MINKAGKQDPGASAPPQMHEADIGSGEKSPGQEETDAMIREIPKLPEDGKPAQGGSGGGSGKQG